MLDMWWQELVRLGQRGVLLVSDVLAPLGVRSPVAGRFGDGQVGHVVVCGCAVPVPDVGGGDDDVAGADLFDGAAARLVQADAVGDQQRLADGVRVPRRAGAGGEPDGVLSQSSCPTSRF